MNEEYSWRSTGFAQSDDHPVVNVSWNDAMEFCRWLSRNEGRTYHLPTEAEWEYACRAGTTTLYSHGNDSEGSARVGNVADVAFKAQYPELKGLIQASDGYAYTSPAGSFVPNPFGLYDMHGNVWEWCADRYDAEYYAKSPAEIQPVLQPARNACTAGVVGSTVPGAAGRRFAARASPRTAT